MQGLEGIAFLSELSDEELKGVRVVKGHHGNLEFQLKGMEPRRTQEVHIIVGNLSDSLRENSGFGWSSNLVPRAADPSNIP